MAEVLIAEELLVLASCPVDGRLLVDDVGLDHALEAARLAELAVREHIAIVDGRLAVIDPASCGDAELDRVLVELADQPVPRTPRWWLARKNTSQLRQHLVSRLVARGVLVSQSYRALGIISAVRYPEQDSTLRRSIEHRIAAVMAGRDPDGRTAALLSLARACRLDRTLFSAADQARVKQIADADWSAESVRHVIRAARVVWGFGLIDIVTAIRS